MAKKIQVETGHDRGLKGCVNGCMLIILVPVALVGLYILLFHGGLDELGKLLGQ